MHDFDLLILIFITVQPSLIGMLLFLLAKVRLVDKMLFSQIKNARKKNKGARFFECATYPRLLNSIKYDIQILPFAIVFIVYDVDFLFFLSEAVYSEFWSNFSAILFATYFVCFILGITYDYLRQKLAWTY